MSFARKVWHLLVAIKDGLALAFLLLFFWALFAVLSGRPSPAAVREGALLLDLRGSVVEEIQHVPPLETILLGSAVPSRQFTAREMVRAIDEAAKDKRIEVIALDMTPDVLAESREIEASLVITHHPLIFRPLRRLTTESLNPSLALGLASTGIALYSIHTNLDAAPGGVSFALGKQLGLLQLDFLEPASTNESGLGAVGHLEQPETLARFLQRVAERLDLVAGHLADREVPRVRMREIEPADGRGRHHCKRFGQRQPDRLFDPE